MVQYKGDSYDTKIAQAEADLLKQINKKAAFISDNSVDIVDKLEMLTMCETNLIPRYKENKAFRSPALWKEVIKLQSPKSAKELMGKWAFDDEKISELVDQL